MTFVDLYDPSFLSVLLEDAAKQNDMASAREYLSWSHPRYAMAREIWFQWWLNKWRYALAHGLEFLATSEIKRIAYQITNAPFSSNSQSILVDKSGDDALGNGTKLRPFRTIKKALTVAMISTAPPANQTCIYINAGNYTEDGPITITCSGITLFGESVDGVSVAPKNRLDTLFVIPAGVHVSFCNMHFVSINTKTKWVLHTCE